MMFVMGAIRFTSVCDIYNSAMYRLSTYIQTLHVVMLYYLAHSNGQLKLAELLEKQELRSTCAL